MVQWNPILTSGKLTALWECEKSSSIYKCLEGVTPLCGQEIIVEMGERAEGSLTTFLFCEMMLHLNVWYR